MGSFINGNKTRVELKISVTVPNGKANEVANDIQQIVSNTTAEELAILRKVCEKPALKSMALAQAKKYVQ